MLDTIFCLTCQKEVDVYEGTTVRKLEHWDLFCTECGRWLCGMKTIYGWEIGDVEDIQKPVSENKTMQR